MGSCYLTITTPRTLKNFGRLSDLLRLAPRGGVPPNSVRLEKALVARTLNHYPACARRSVFNFASLPRHI